MPKSSGILFCGGGTGGHVLPGLAVAEQLRQRGEHDLRWIGDPQRIEARLVPQAGIALLPFGMNRPRPWQPRWVLGTLAQAWRCARELLLRPPRAVVALGGYAALLPGLLAPLHRRPLIVMEQNARAGRTNRLLARFARVIVTQFPEAAERLPGGGRVRRLGNPVRPIRFMRRGRAAKLRVLVVGGSLAAKSLNDLVALAAEHLARIDGLRIVQCAGEQDCARIASIYRAYGLDAEVHGYVDDMPALYDGIDVAVTRAGATTVAELCAAGIGAIYVPLPWAADDHQTANAEAVARVGGAVVIQQAVATPTDLAAHLMRWANDRAAVERMGLNARLLARPRAAAEVAAIVDGFGRPDGGRQKARRQDARAVAVAALLAGTGAVTSAQPVGVHP